MGLTNWYIGFEAENEKPVEKDSIFDTATISDLDSFSAETEEFDTSSSRVSKLKDLVISIGSSAVGKLTRDQDIVLPPEDNEE